MIRTHIRARILAQPFHGRRARAAILCLGNGFPAPLLIRSAACSRRGWVPFRCILVTAPTIGNLAEALGRSLQALGFEAPIDMAGNSLGGLLALECARQRIARAVVAISPPGLWTDRGAAHVEPLFRVLRVLTSRAPWLVRPMLRQPLVREVLLAVPLSVGSRRMPIADALRVADDLARSTAFEDTFDQIRPPFSAREITAPLTVAFGGRDWILPNGSRSRGVLPAHTRWIEKREWGHVPMWMDPAGVARLILEGTSNISTVAS